MTVGPGSWVLMSKGGSPGSSSNKWVCSAGNSWSGLASLEPEASRKPAFPVRGSQPLSGSLGEGRALSSVLTQNSVGLGSQQKEVRLHWTRLLFPSSLAGAWERGKEFGVQISVLARSDRNLLLIKGAIPGPKKGFVIVKETVKPKKVAKK